MNYFLLTSYVIVIFIVFLYAYFNRTKKKKKKRRKKIEYVYVITHKKFKFKKYYKIGKATDYKKRIKQLQTSSPYSYKVVKIFETTKPFALENLFHKRFEKRKKQGEWFSFYFFEMPFILLKMKKLSKTHNKK